MAKGMAKGMARAMVRATEKDGAADGVRDGEDLHTGERAATKISLMASHLNSEQMSKNIQGDATRVSIICEGEAGSRKLTSIGFHNATFRYHG